MLNQNKEEFILKYFKDENVRKKIFIGVFLIIFFFICYNIKEVWGAAGTFFNIIFPFIMGAAIAFVLNVPMRCIERCIPIGRKKEVGSKLRGLRRGLALILTLVLTVCVLTFLSYMIIPQLLSTIGQLIKQIPPGIRQLSAFAQDRFNNEPIIQEIIQNFAKDWQSLLENFMGILKNTLNGALTGGINAVTGIVSGVFNFIIGLIFALYILVQKEKLGTQAKMIVYALFEEKKADEILSVAHLSSKTFANFISGQCTEALILASMFSITMMIMKLPYALLIGLLIGATSLIPLVGTFIGCFIGAILILLVDPMDALVFVIMFIILQQIEGNLIYPKVVGDSVGLPGIWVLVSATLGASLFGIPGIIIFIPLISVLYSLFRKYIYAKLLEKNMEDPFDYKATFKQPKQTAGQSIAKKLTGKNQDTGNNNAKGNRTNESNDQKTTSNQSGKKSSKKKKK